MSTLGHRRVSSKKASDTAAGSLHFQLLSGLSWQTASCGLMVVAENRPRGVSCAVLARGQLIREPRPTGTAALASLSRVGGMTCSSDTLDGAKVQIRVTHPIFGGLASATALACAIVAWILPWLMQERDSPPFSSGHSGHAAYLTWAFAPARAQLSSSCTPDVPTSRLRKHERKFGWSRQVEYKVDGCCRSLLVISW